MGHQTLTLLKNIGTKCQPDHFTKNSFDNPAWRIRTCYKCVRKMLTLRVNMRFFVAKMENLRNIKS